MCFAISEIRLLTLTARKADCEYDISVNTLEKMALTRQQSNLSKEYYAKLRSANISYYANGQYNMMDYGYLMGNAFTATNILTGETSGMKKDNSMILTDYNGLVVLSDSYAQVLQKVLGSSCMDANGRGGTFSVNKIPEIISEIAGGYCSTEEVEEIIKGGSVSSTWDGGSTTSKSKSGEVVSTGGTHDNTSSASSKIEAIVDYYYPIFQAAAANGWTTEYNKEIAHNKNYVSDALVTGSLQLEQVDCAGAYKPDASLTYFVTSGLVVERTDSSVREEVTAWYNAEKELISEKEGWIDMEISDLSTELEAINTEIESVKSLLQDATNAFDWCSG